jgi:hypothetical protein
LFQAAVAAGQISQTAPKRHFESCLAAGSTALRGGLTSPLVPFAYVFDSDENMRFCSIQLFNQSNYDVGIPQFVGDENTLIDETG